MIISEKKAYRKILKALIDDFSNSAQLAAAFIYRTYDVYSDFSRSKFSPFCKKMSEIPLCYRLCLEDHHFRAFRKEYYKPLMCHAGLFNIGYPIKLEGENVATILCGQVKIRGRENESRKKFEDFLSNLNVSESDKKELRMKFDQVKHIEEKDLSQQPVSRLKEYGKLLIEVLEEERLASLKVDALAHELILPIQSMLIDADNISTEAREKNPDLNFLTGASGKLLDEVFKLNLHVQNMRTIFLRPMQETKSEFRKKNLYAMVMRSIERFEAEAKSKDVLIKKPIGRFPELEVLEYEMQIALNNIYSNAVKYSYWTPSISKDYRYIETKGYDVTVDRKPMYRIDVSNFGVGILPHEIREGRIYRDGYRGELSIDRNRTGSGVGLYLVKQIVEKEHKGVLEVSSIDEGSGSLTRVSASIPYYQD